MTRQFYTIIICISLLWGCKEIKSNDEHLSLDLESTMNADNYFLSSANKILFNLVVNKYKSDSVKNISQYRTAVKLNELNKNVENLFGNIRAELLSTLNGYMNLAIGDTLNLSNVNYEEKTITKKYFENEFQNKLDEIKFLQIELDGFGKDHIWLHSNKEWTKKEYTAKEFIIQLTITRNLLLKQINCIYEDRRVFEVLPYELGV